MFPYLILVPWVVSIVVLLYSLWLATRFVLAVEKIADRNRA